MAAGFTQRRRAAEVVKVRLGEVCTQVRGVSYKPQDARDSNEDGFIPLLRANNIGVGVINHDEMVFVRSDCVNVVQLLRKGDLLVCASSGSRHLVGKAAKVVADVTETFGAFCKIVRPNPAYVDADYISQYFQSDIYRKTIASKSAGASINNIRSEHLDDLLIPLPPLADQKQIAAKLDAICAIVAKREEQLKKLDQLVKSRFVEMFGDDDFNKSKLSACVEQMFIGPFGSSLKNECFVDESDAYCMVYEQKHAIHKDMTLPSRYVNREKYDELRRFEVGPGDIIVSCRGTVGEVFLIPDDAPTGIMHPSIMKIRLKRGVFDNTYFLFALRKFMIDNEHRAQGSGVKMAVTATVLGNEDFVIPPLALQREFAAFVAEVDKSKFAVRKSLESYQKLYRQQLQEAFG